MLAGFQIPLDGSAQLLQEINRRQLQLGIHPGDLVLHQLFQIGAGHQLVQGNPYRRSHILYHQGIDPNGIETGQKTLNLSIGNLGRCQQDLILGILLGKFLGHGLIRKYVDQVIKGLLIAFHKGKLGCLGKKGIDCLVFFKLFDQKTIIDRHVSTSSCVIDKDGLGCQSTQTCGYTACSASP